MPELVTLGSWLRRFLCEHIVTERNLARNTRKSYRDTFSLLLPFSSGKLRKPVDRLAVCDLTSRHVLQFLTHLEEERGCSARTRNQRLAVIRAFARFVGSRDPAHVEWCGHIRAIASHRRPGLGRRTIVRVIVAAWMKPQRARIVDSLDATIAQVGLDERARDRL